MKVHSLTQRSLRRICQGKSRSGNAQAPVPAGSQVRSRPRVSSAFALVEALIAMIIVSLVAVALYAGITSCFFSIRLARENLRATQIMIEKMEIIRLLTWDQLNSGNIMPTQFTATYASSGTNTTNGLVYKGKITIAPVTTSDLAVDYRADLRMVTVELSWKTGNLDRSRKVISYVSRYGLQNYVFN